MVSTMEIQVRWEGPFTCEVVRDKASDDDSYGLYQIYGVHSVYSPNAETGVLLYVGMTTHQTFAPRLGQHWDSWLKAEASVEIRLGRLDKGCYDDKNRDGHWGDWCRKVDLAERLTIWQHCPSYNSQYVASFPLQGEGEVVVENLGHRGSLAERYCKSELERAWRPEMVELL